MKVVSDTTAICYLLKIGQVELLPLLFQQIFLPRGVLQELSHPNSDDMLRLWSEAPPKWVEVHEVVEPLDRELRLLDRGEREAIRLAEKISADLIILDERQGRHVAKLRGLRVTGLLGVLKLGAETGRLDLRDALTQLKETNFHVHPKLLQKLLDGAP